MKNTATGPQASWGAALRRFDADLRCRGAGERTRRAYGADVAELATWAVARGVEPAAVTERLLRAYGGRPAERKLAAARAFFRSMVEHGDMAVNPADLLPHPDSAPKPGTIASLPAVTPLELRDRALFELARGHGLGAEELVGLDVGSERLLGDPPPAALAAYLERGRPVLAAAGGDPALFLSKSGLRLSSSDVRRRLSAWTRRAPTTRVHTRIESGRLRAAYLRSHPRA
jgi:integrase/recombinase XerC/integrase/recombinase XerD